MNILELLAAKTGKGIKVAAIDTGKAAEKTGEVIVEELPTVAAVASAIAPEISPVFSVAGSIAGLVASRKEAPLLSSDTLPASNPLSKVMAGIFETSITGENMNPLESFAITMVLGILQSVIKNPAHKAVLETQLVGIADQIYTAYGMPVPAPTATAAPVKA